MDNHNTSSDSRDRLDRIKPSSVQGGYSPAYSKFIRAMRLFLPLLAIIILAAVFAWSTLNQNVVPQASPDQVEKNAKNELIKPRFESTDNKNRPYTITAERAVQDTKDEDIVFLEFPRADMLLEEGKRLDLESRDGVYNQLSRHLVLEEDVKLSHNDGYSAQTRKLEIDLNANTAWTDEDVTGSGPEGTLEAKGLKANSAEGTLILKGPAKVVLEDTGAGLTVLGRPQE